jgi:hypothetical protein
MTTYDPEGDASETQGVAFETQGVARDTQRVALETQGVAFGVVCCGLTGQKTRVHDVTIGLVGLSAVGAAQRELRPPAAERQNEGNVTNEANWIRWLERHKMRREL